MDTNNSEVGHFFERSWYYIFNLHKKNILLNPDYIIVGSGLSGSVIAERLSTNKKNKILLIEKRDHIGGNCYDYNDSDTNILVSKYGAHLFHTNSEKVWDYVNYIDKWIPYNHKVYGKIDDKIFPIPINITTVNILCNKDIKNSDEMVEYLDSVRDKTIVDPQNSEEYCLSVFGKEIGLFVDTIFHKIRFCRYFPYSKEKTRCVFRENPFCFKVNFRRGDPC